MSAAQETFPVGERPRLEVRIARGRVRIEAGAAGAIDVAARGPVERLTIAQTGDVVTVAEEPGGSARGSFDVTVRLPAETAVDVKLATADLTVDATVRELSGRTASGDVRVHEVTDRVDLRTASGDVEAETVGSADVTTASGDVRIGTATGAVSVGTASGDIRVGTADDELGAKSASGDLVVGLFRGASLDARTVSGDVRLALPGGRRVSYDIKTLSGRVDLPSDAPVSAATERPQRVRLRVKSVSGDVTVRTA